MLTEQERNVLAEYLARSDKNLAELISYLDKSLFKDEIAALKKLSKPTAEERKAGILACLKTFKKAEFNEQLQQFYTIVSHPSYALAAKVLVNAKFCDNTSEAKQSVLGLIKDFLHNEHLKDMAGSSSDSDDVGFFCHYIINNIGNAAEKNTVHYSLEEFELIKALVIIEKMCDGGLQGSLGGIKDALLKELTDRFDSYITGLTTSGAPDTIQKMAKSQAEKFARKMESTLKDFDERGYSVYKSQAILDITAKLKELKKTINPPISPSGSLSSQVRKALSTRNKDENSHGGFFGSRRELKKEPSSNSTADPVKSPGPVVPIEINNNRGDGRKKR